MSLKFEDIPAKVIADCCEAGGWPRPNSFKILKEDFQNQTMIVQFEFEEILSPCCSCIAQDESFIRRGEFVFSENGPLNGNPSR